MTEEEKRVEVIARSLPAIVSISVSKKIETIDPKKSGGVFPLFERDRAKMKAINQRITGDQLDFGGGSGFVVDEAGIIITNIHVIKQQSLDYEVSLHDGSVHQARLIDADPIHDVAYLRMITSPAQTFFSLPLGDSTHVQLGQTVYAIGDVLGVFPETVSRGIVSGLGRTIEAHNEERKETLHDLIQTDAAINPGNSGGPLLNSEGEVIGINSANVSQAENIGFAVPINAIKNDLQDIVTQGKIRRAFLGVRHVVITRTIARGLNLPSSEGILVTSPSPHQSAIIDKSPADKAGMRENDIIVSINDMPLNERYTLEDFLEDAKGGDEARMRIMRDGKEIMLVTTLLEKPSS